MSSEKRILAVIYIIIPLMVLTAFLPLLASMQQQGMPMQYQQNVLLYPRVIQRGVGLMTPCSSSDSVYKDYEAVKAVLDEIPDAYIANNIALGAAATISRLKTYLSITDRTHVAAHGSWVSTPVVTLDSDLKKSVVDQWSQQGLCCKLLLLRACNSMGHDGSQSNLLASAIIAKSGVQGVIGYKDLVDAGGALLFASLFWTAHLWANEAAGGISSNDAYSDARDGIHQVICDESLEANWNSYVIGVTIGVIMAILTAVLHLPPIVTVAITTVVGMYYLAGYTAFVNSLNSACYNVVKYGASVAGLTYSGGGGGGGDLPF